MLLFSDTHFENFSEFATPWKEGCNSRLRSQLDVLDGIFHLTWLREQKHLIFLGDWFHRWNAVNTPVYSMVTRRLYDLLDRNSDVKLYMLLGNHDMPDKGNWAVHTLAAYSVHPSITVIDKPTTIQIDGHCCIFVPYHQNHDIIFSEVQRLSKLFSGNAWLFSHLDIIGARICLDGGKWKSDIGLNINSLGDHVTGGIFGHYHIPQELDEKTVPGFSYVGAPMHLSTVDANTNDRRVLQLEKGVVTTHVLKGTPQFIKFSADDPPSTIRPEDYHIITCKPEDAAEVWYKYNKEKISMKVACSKRNDDSILSVDPTNDVDMVKAWTRSHKGMCELDMAMLLNYAEYYMGLET